MSMSFELVPSASAPASTCRSGCERLCWCLLLSFGLCLCLSSVLVRAALYGRIV